MPREPVDDTIRFEECGAAFEIFGPAVDGSRMVAITDASGGLHGYEARSFEDACHHVDAWLDIHLSPDAPCRFKGLRFLGWDHETRQVGESTPLRTRGQFLEMFEGGASPTDLAAVRKWFEGCGNVLFEIRDGSGALLLDCRDEARRRFESWNRGHREHDLAMLDATMDGIGAPLTAEIGTSPSGTGAPSRVDASAAPSSLRSSEPQLTPDSMPIAPSHETRLRMDRDRSRHAARERFLDAVADHVEGPSEATWAALGVRSSELDRTEDSPIPTPTEAARDLGAFAEALIARDARAWARFLSVILGWGPGLVSQGPGARLKALSPYAGRTLLTYSGGAVGGEVGRLFEETLWRAGADTSPGAAYLLAIEPGTLDAAPVAIVSI